MIAFKIKSDKQIQNIFIDFFRNVLLTSCVSPTKIQAFPEFTSIPIEKFVRALLFFNKQGLKF